MPRICTSTNDPVDFCGRCYPRYEQALEKYENLGNGPDGRGNCFEYDASHPDYGGEQYRCIACGVELTDDDNY